MADSASVPSNPTSNPAAPAKVDTKPTTLPGNKPAKAEGVVGKPDGDVETYIVDGQEVKLTKAQAKAAVQKGLFADKQLQSVAQLRKGTESLLGALKTPEGLISLLKDPALGANPKEVFKKLMASDIIDDELKETMSRWVYDNIVVQSKKTPEQLQAEKQAAELERYKKQEADLKAKQASEQEKAQITQVYTAIRAEVSKQIQADPGFPQTEYNVRSVIEKLRVMNKQGVPITVESIDKAIKLVKKDNLTYQTSLLDTAKDEEELIARLGEERALKISKALVARLKKKAAAKDKPKEGEVVEGQRKPKNPKELQDMLNKRFGKTR